MAHYGLTWHELHEEITWAQLQRMLIDAPSYDYEEGQEVEELTLTDDNAQEILELLT